MEDGCGREIYLQGLFEVPYDALELTMPNDTLLCNGAAAVMELEIEGGQPPYQIQWDDFNDEELVHVVDPEESTEYEVVVVDNCDYSEFASTKVDVQTVKTTIVRESLGDDTYVFDVLTILWSLRNAYFYVWELGTAMWLTSASPHLRRAVPMRPKCTSDQHWLFRRRGHGHLRRRSVLHPHRVHA